MNLVQIVSSTNIEEIDELLDVIVMALDKGGFDSSLMMKAKNYTCRPKPVDEISKSYPKLTDSVVPLTPKTDR